MADTGAAIMGGQDQVVKRQNLQIMGQKELDIEIDKLEKLEVLKAITGNMAIGKAKTETCYNAKNRSTNMIILILIA